MNSSKHIQFFNKLSRALSYNQLTLNHSIEEIQEIWKKDIEFILSAKNTGIKNIQINHFRLLHTFSYNNFYELWKYSFEDIQSLLKKRNKNARLFHEFSTWTIWEFISYLMEIHYPKTSDITKCTSGFLQICNNISHDIITSQEEFETALSHLYDSYKITQKTYKKPI